MKITKLSWAVGLLFACGSEMSDEQRAGLSEGQEYRRAVIGSVDLSDWVRVGEPSHGFGVKGGLAVESPWRAPPRMSCVSQATVPEGDWIPHVDRLHIITDGQDGLAELSLQRGPQFREHAEHNQRESGPESTLTVKLSIRRNELELEGAQVRVTLSVAPGPFFRGTLRTNGLSQTLTCWDDDVLGGLWSAPTVTLPAHFDWQTGVCVDSLGRPALNVLPIELVRETGFGECADLRGLSLNDGDLNQPNLAGWALFGADLSGARLFFADLTDASLDGASFADLEFGYAHINGTFGATTQFPEVCQTLVSNPWAGQRLQCVQ